MYKLFATTLISAVVLTAPALAGAEQCSPEQIRHNEELPRRLATADLGDAKNLRKTVEELMDPDYVQHNPLISDLKGREGFITAVARLIEQKIPPEYKMPQFVMANCDYVAAMILFKRPDPDRPGQTYDSYWFDLWRVKNGRFIEHWDQAIKGQDYHWDIVLPMNKK